MNITLDEMLARSGVDESATIINTSNLHQDFTRVDGLTPDGIGLWLPSCAEDTGKLKVRVHDSADPTGCEIYLFAIPPAPINILFGGPGNKLSILTSDNFAANIQMFRPSNVVIGQGATCGSARIFAGNSDVTIGKDALLSDEILLQSTDQHGVLDLNTRHIINHARTHITIDSHVWIGRRVIVTKNVHIGGGSILATGAVVTKSVPQFTAVGGNPAQPIKSEVSWSRNPVMSCHSLEATLNEIEAIRQDN